MLYKGENIAVRMNGRSYHCALDITMDFLGGKWKAVVLWYLRDKPKRFGELKRLMPEITEKMLSLQLKKLEKDGLVLRKAFAEVPPRVEYSLTKEGRTLRPALDALASWGRRKGQREGEIIPAKARPATKAA
jgi:DNA-binding HxlR family transcriptional regulator